MNEIPPPYLADLNTCAREPIHTPGSIQPHGILLVVNRHDLVIEQHAGESRFLLGVEASFLSLRSLSIFFEESVLNTLLAHLPDRPTRTPSLAFSIHSRTGPLPLNASLHVLGERVFIELEAARYTHNIHGEPLTRVMSMLAATQSASNFTELCDAAARHVRAISDFDRVMIYQFLHDGHGAVIAETKASGQKETFLGLHYPSSDIPSQARDLYLRNWLRFIPDVHYQPAPLVSARTDIGDEPLDMSYCTLRSISPTHIKYLCNMGVGASMSLSIIVDNKLWGLITCHNDTPHYITAELRIACTLFAKVFSLQLKAKLAAETAQRDHASQHVLELLSRTLLKSKDIAMDLISGEVTLLDLIPANGIAVLLNGRLCCRGETPPV